MRGQFGVETKRIVQPNLTTPIYSFCNANSKAGGREREKGKGSGEKEPQENSLRYHAINESGRSIVVFHDPQRRTGSTDRQTDTPTANLIN